PLVELHARARAWEYAGEILAASYFPVQHGLDFPEASYATVVITNNDPETADRIALELAKAAWERRHEFDVSTLSPEEAIAKGLKIEGEPIVLSEASDCVGGGASGDSAIVLKALLEFAGGIPAAIMIVDPETVQAARDAGIGGRFQARIGNKHSAVYGEPVKAEAEVLRLYKDCRFTYSSGPAGGFEGRMGPTALLQVGSVQVIVPSLPTYEYADEQFIAVGVQPRNCKFVIVKNPMNFQQAFAYAPALISLDTPGPTTCHVREPLWKNLDRPIYPIDDDFTPIFQGF
ncbi:MAG: M81 family metallopeptidase, partial [Deltaproteobacteria bacterium]|nr:M81 family metallopeptidase [Deltaproteobacteria bacterium]